MNEQLRILMLVPGAVGRRPMGPQVRAFEIARALSRPFHVTVATIGGLAPPGFEALRVIPGTRRRMLTEACRSDAVLAPWIPPFLLPVLLARGTAIVPDLFDPAEFEIATGQSSEGNAELASLRRLTDIQLVYGDIIACGGNRQRERLAAALRRLGRRDGPAIVVVPFGVEEPPTPPGVHPLREKFGFSPDDVVVLWWGSLWRWYDPCTAVRAVANLSKRLPRIRLVFQAASPPDPDAKAIVRTEPARELAEELGVLDDIVYFLEDWVPYEVRHHLLLDADIGICLHGDEDEAEFAVRARYFDYIWCSLPCVLSTGDELADEMGATGLASLVPPEDLEATEAAIDSLAEDPALRRAQREAGQRLARRYRWADVTRPLVEELTEPLGSSGHLRGALAAMGPVADFYRHRVVDAMRSRGVG